MGREEKMNEDLEALASAVESEKFQAQQQAFFLKWCDVFEKGDENSLENTRIHKVYEEESEDGLVKLVGEDLIVRVCEGIEEGMGLEGDGITKSERVVTALAILQSMTDYRSFKQTMILKQQEKVIPASVNISGKEVPVLDLDGAVKSVEEIRSVQGSGEWQKKTDYTFPSGHFVVLDTKPVPNSKKTAVRFSFRLNVPFPVLMGAMSADPAHEFKVGEELPDHHKDEYVKSMQVVKVLPNKDLVFKMHMTLPWLARWMTGLPEVIYLLERIEFDYPNHGEVSFVQTPYDFEKGVALEKVGMMGFKMYNCSPDPEDPEKTRLTIYETHELGIFSSNQMLIQMNAWPVDLVGRYIKTKLGTRPLPAVIAPCM